MAQVPANIKLYEMFVAQAKAKYSTYPSPGASHWVHSQYEKHGGRFIESSEKTKHDKLMKQRFEAKKKALLERRHAEAQKGKKKHEDN
jgi:hypothetical protein